MIQSLQAITLSLEFFMLAQTKETSFDFILCEINIVGNAGCSPETEREFTL